MATQEAPERDASGIACPTCGAPAERGQLVCLECGSRITLAYRRPPSWKLPVALTILVLLLAGAGGVLAYRAIDDNAKEEVAAAPAKVADKKGGEKGEGDAKGGDSKKEAADDEPKLGPEEEKPEEKPADKEKAEKPAEDDEEPADEPGGIVRKGDLYTWPRSLDGFTVVLLSAEDRQSATSFARSAAEPGGEEIGVIRSDDFETLPKGFFVVFAGEYPGRPAAERAASRLGKRFPGAFPQRVSR